MSSEALFATTFLLLCRRRCSVVIITKQKHKFDEKSVSGGGRSSQWDIFYQLNLHESKYLKEDAGVL